MLDGKTIDLTEPAKTLPFEGRFRQMVLESARRKLKKRGAQGKGEGERQRTTGPDTATRLDTAVPACGGGYAVRLTGACCRQEEPLTDRCTRRAGALHEAS